MSLLPIWLHCLLWILEDDTPPSENSPRNAQNQEWIVLQINSVIKSCLLQSAAEAPETSPEHRHRVENSLTHIFSKVLEMRHSGKLAFQCKELARHHKLDKLFSKITTIENRILAEDLHHHLKSGNEQNQPEVIPRPASFTPQIDLSKWNSTQSTKQDISLFKSRSKQQSSGGSGLYLQLKTDAISSNAVEEASCLPNETLDHHIKFPPDGSHRKEAFFDMFIKTRSIKKPPQHSKQDVESGSRKEFRIDSTDLSLKEAAKKNLEQERRTDSPNCRITSLRPQRKVVKISKLQNTKNHNTDKIKKNKQSKNRKPGVNRKCSFDDLKHHKGQTSKRANKKPSEKKESHFIGPQFFDHMSLECRSEDLNLFKSEKEHPISLEKPVPIVSRRQKAEPLNIHLSPPRTRRSFEDLQSKQVDDWMDQIVAMGTPSRSPSPLGFNDRRSRRSADRHL